MFSSILILANSSSVSMELCFKNLSKIDVQVWFGVKRQNLDVCLTFYEFSMRILNGGVIRLRLPVQPKDGPNPVTGDSS